MRDALQRRLGVSLRPAAVAFLGLWDTVPGSSFKTYEDCREARDMRPGERYKTGSYPSIAKISHAVALDEKRSMFRPILLCPAMDPRATTVHEMWFAGAHADIGGGYDGGVLNGVALSWMADELSEALGVAVPVAAVTDAVVMAPAHWSIGDRPANYGSRCLDRVPPVTARVHPSAQARRRMAQAPLVVGGRTETVAYPRACADIPTQP